jgi:3-oxoacyl-[acyl-carrier-protein] synthase II
MVVPAASDSEVCVSAMAWATPLGNDLDGAWQQLLAGRTGLRDHRGEFELRNHAAGCLPGADLSRPVASRQHELAVDLLGRACLGADLSVSDGRIRVVLGTSYGSDLDEPTASLADWAVAATAAAGATHPPVSLSTACSAGSDAILIGAELVRSGAAAICVAGGVDVLSNAKRLGHSALGTLSPTELRAFDVRHDGMLPGEGGALLVLESAASLRARGGQALAVLCGGGAANDACALTAPDESGHSVVLAVNRALRAADLDAGDIDLLSAHGTGTVLNDGAECRSLATLFPEDGPMLFATKGALGHSLGAVGAIEAVCTILALRTGRLPPVAGLRHPLPALTLPVALPGARGVGGVGGVGASVTIGFGGFNTCLIFAVRNDHVAT